MQPKAKAKGTHQGSQYLPSIAGVRKFIGTWFASIGPHCLAAAEQQVCPTEILKLNFGERTPAWGPLCLWQCFFETIDSLVGVRSVLWACSESLVSNIMPAVLVPATLQKRAECCPGRRLFKTKAQINWDFGISYVWYTKCDNCAQDLTSYPEFGIWGKLKKVV